MENKRLSKKWKKKENKKHPYKSRLKNETQDKPFSNNTKTIHL